MPLRCGEVPGQHAGGAEGRARATQEEIEHQAFEEEVPPGGTVGEGANGRITKDDLRNILDLSPREWAVFAPLIVLTLWMGIYPSSFTGFFDASVGAMVQQHTAALATTTKLAGMIH